jgi:hypothetical protein
MSAVDRSSGSNSEVDAETSPERSEMTAAVTRFIEHRSAIERTKGMLMLIYGIDESTAFQLLKWRSQENNVKLRHLAERIATDFLKLGERDSHPSKSAYDEVLLSAHLRLDGENPSRDGIALNSSDEKQLGLKA